MSNEKKASGYSAVLALLRPLTSCFNVSGEGKMANSSKPASDPEAVMVAAAKHFSSAHKIKFG